MESFIGATPFRPESGELMHMSSRPSYYDTDEWIEFDETLHSLAEQHDVEIIRGDHATGLWDGTSEPAGAYIVRADNFQQVRDWAGAIAGRYDQDSVMAGLYDPNGPDTVYAFTIDDTDTETVLGALREVGVLAGRTYDGKLEIASTGDLPMPDPARAALVARFGDASAARAHVEFIEQTKSYLAHSPIKEIQSLRQNYAAGIGLPARERMPHLTEIDDIAAARAYEQAPHQPKHPLVARSYRSFRQHIVGQWDTLTAAGYRFEPWHGATEQPYLDSAAMIADLRENKHLFYFRTDVSQDTDGALPTDHPMARTVTVTTADGQRQQMIANDVFRAVHDAIAHGEGHQFGPHGEKRAWWAHRSSLPREARLALWCETRAQNCWTNAGPHMTTTGNDDTPRVLRRDEAGWLPLPQRPYAQQKCVRVHPSLL